MNKMKSLLRSVVAVLILIFVSQPGVLHAEGNDPAPAQPQQSGTQTGQSPAPVPSSGLDVQPMNPQHAAEGFRRMGADIGIVGEGMPFPITIVGLLISGILLLIGAIFNKRLLLAGFGVLGILVLLWLIMGDMMQATRFFDSFTGLLRSYW